MKKLIALILLFASVAATAAEANKIIPRRKPLTANVGIVGVGLDTYWKQFDGLRDVMMDKLSRERSIKTASKPSTSGW